jgi:hypothetical protein
MPRLSPRLRRFTAAFVLVAGVACSSDSAVEPPPTQSGEMSQLAAAYIEQVLSIMQSNSIKRLTIDWPAFRGAVLARAPGAQTIPELEQAIAHAVQLLGDGHSSFRTAGGRSYFFATRTCRSLGAINFTPPPRIGYVRVSSFSGTTQQALDFANLIQANIRVADHDSIAGWIVDLRGNGGGNMWPMVAGLGPILGEDVIGWFIDPVGRETSWESRLGGSYSGGFLAQRVDNPYRLRRERPKVAVLVDNGVASSGEATFIAFLKRPNTRSFGVPTCGLSTANAGFPLSDGALLNLTVSTMADRAKVKYGDQVQPDEVIGTSAQIEQRAVAWLLSSS